MARRFRFRLETVRKLRERERDEQQRAVADALRTVRRVEERIASLNEQLHSTLDRSRAIHMPGQLDVVSARGHQFYRGLLHRRILEAGIELSASRAVLDSQRARMARASQRLKVIENLRDRQWTRYRAEVAREEQTAADEVAIQRYLRKSGPGSEEQA